MEAPPNPRILEWVPPTTDRGCRGPIRWLDGRIPSVVPPPRVSVFCPAAVRKSQVTLPQCAPLAAKETMKWKRTSLPFGRAGNWGKLSAGFHDLGTPSAVRVRGLGEANVGCDSSVSGRSEHLRLSSAVRLRSDSPSKCRRGSTWQARREQRRSAAPIRVPYPATGHR
jgi:hypothetical protein